MALEVACSCGNRVRVTAGQAGTAVACRCGRTVPVPTLGELREAEAAAGHVPVARRETDWSGLRVWGVVLLIAGQVFGCLYPLLLYKSVHTLEDFTSGRLVASFFLLAMQAAGYLLWGRSKGYPAWACLLLLCLGPLDLIVLICFPDRHR